MLVTRVEGSKDRSRVDVVRSAARNALETADQLGCRSVSMPVFGTGYRRLDYQTGLRTLGETITNFESESLTAVEVVCYRTEEYQLARRLYKQYPTPWSERTVEPVETEEDLNKHLQSDL